MILKTKAGLVEVVDRFVHEGNVSTTWRFQDWWSKAEERNPLVVAPDINSAIQMLRWMERDGEVVRKIP